MNLQTPLAVEKGSHGWALYERAKKLIPGGTQLLSKRPEIFLPENWPCYYSRAKGCAVWDLEDRQFIDMTTTGIGACLLGYVDDDVNTAAKGAIDRGNLTTLNVPAEVELAQQLVDIHPWADMVRYARSGGESMMIAVRIARAFTGRSGIALCGYHGWGDWYLAANLGEDSTLDGHLLPGLQPTGVPTELRNTSRTFRYNQIEELEGIAATHGSTLGAIVMEPIRFSEPTNGFLEKVRAIADRTGAVLIFDEITSGWRHRFGGSHLLLGVNPDIAVYAKSIANGFPMAAIVGGEAVMQAAQDSFISSTFWTEAIGPTAAIATLKKMQDVDLVKHVQAAGKQAQAGWKSLADKHHLNITVSGLPALCTFSFNCDSTQAAMLKTLLTQEMLDRGYLATTTFYPTLAHDERIVSGYLAALDEVFELLSRAIRSGNVAEHLRGPVAAGGFSRLT
jgi:glutamate-1-semialdehyde 2,1-aminomutase